MPRFLRLHPRLVELLLRGTRILRAMTADYSSRGGQLLAAQLLALVIDRPPLGMTQLVDFTRQPAPIISHQGLDKPGITPGKSQNVRAMRIRRKVMLINGKTMRVRNGGTGARRTRHEGSITQGKRDFKTTVRTNCTRSVLTLILSTKISHIHGYHIHQNLSLPERRGAPHPPPIRPARSGSLRPGAPVPAPGTRQQSSLRGCSRS